MGQTISIRRERRPPRREKHPPVQPGSIKSSENEFTGYPYPMEIGSKQTGYVDRKLLEDYLEKKFPLDQFPDLTGSNDNRFQIHVRHHCM